MRRQLLVVVAAVLAGLAAASAAPVAAVPAPITPSPVAATARPTWTVTTTTVATHDGVRPLRLAVPSTWDAHGRRVLVVLHGAWSSPAAMLRVSDLEPRAALAGVAVLTLSALPSPTATWNAGACCLIAAARRTDDRGYVAAAVGWLRARYAVPASRTTLVGYSNGGMLAYDVACRRPGLVGRVVVVAGARLTACPTTTSTTTAVLHVHGDADRTVPLLGTSWQPVLRAALPSAQRALVGAGGLAGCTGFVRRASGVTTTLAGTGCRAPVALVVVHALGHAWSTAPPYDETAAALAFALR